MNASSIAGEFDEKGFAIARGLFSPGESADIERAIGRFLTDVAPALPSGNVYYEGKSKLDAVKSIHGMNEHDSFFRELLGDPRLIELLRAIWPDGEIVGSSVMFFGKAAGDGSAAPAHQDNAFQCWDPPLALTATIAIDASSPENGALTCLSGSHRAGFLPHRQSGVMGFSRTLVRDPDTSAYPAVQLCMQPGDVALHHVNTIHMSGPNRSPHPRRQLGLSYHSSLARVDQTAWDDYQQKLKDLHAAAASAS